MAVGSVLETIVIDMNARTVIPCASFSGVRKSPIVD